MPGILYLQKRNLSENIEDDKMFKTIWTNCHLVLLKITFLIESFSPLGKKIVVFEVLMGSQSAYSTFASLLTSGSTGSSILVTTKYE